MRSMMTIWPRGYRVVGAPRDELDLADAPRRDGGNHRRDGAPQVADTHLARPLHGGQHARQQHVEREPREGAPDEGQGQVEEDGQAEAERRGQPHHADAGQRGRDDEGREEGDAGRARVPTAVGQGVAVHVCIEVRIEVRVEISVQIGVDVRVAQVAQ